MIQHAACEVNAHHLHPQAQTKIQNFLLTRIPRRKNFPFDAARAKPARDEDPVRVLHHIPAFVFFKVSRVHPADLHFHVVGERGVFQRLAHRHVRVLQFNILSNQGNFHGLFWFSHALHKFFPWFHVHPARGLHVQLLNEIIADARLLQQ